MEERLARAIALSAHEGQCAEWGEPLVSHLRRVAHCVPDEARAVAWLHEVFERGRRTAAELRSCGLSHLELRALDLLTPAPGDDDEVHAMRIAFARGPAGELARAVALADLTDVRLATAPATGAGARDNWARRHLLASRGLAGSPLRAA